MDVVVIIHGFDVHSFTMLMCLLCEIGIRIVDEPLIVDTFDVDLLTASAYDFLGEIVEYIGLVRIDHYLLHPVLRPIDRHAYDFCTDGFHLTHVVSILVDLLLRLHEFRITRCGYSKLIDDSFSGEFAISFDIDDRYRYDRVDEFLCESVFGDHLRILLHCFQ